MVVPSLRQSRFLRAAVLTTWAASLLAWIYITLRIVLNGVDPPQPFLPGVRFPTFLQVGAFAFFVFCTSMFVYLWLWASIGGSRPPPDSPYGRHP